MILGPKNCGEFPYELIGRSTPCIGEGHPTFNRESL